MRNKKHLVQLAVAVILTVVFTAASAGDNQNGRKASDVDERERSMRRHPIMEEVVSRHPRFKEISDELKEINHKIRELVREYREKDEAQREEMKEEIKEKLLERFDMVTDLHGSMIDEAQERLEKLSDKLEKRLEMKDDIIRRELDGILRGRPRRDIDSEERRGRRGIEEDDDTAETDK